HAEHRVVDEDLDMLAQLPPVPQGMLQLGKLRGQSFEHRAHRRVGTERLLEHPPAGAVTTDELRHPGGDFDGDGRFHSSSYFCLIEATTVGSASVVVSPST